MTLRYIPLEQLDLDFPTETELRSQIRSLARIYLPELTDRTAVSDLVRFIDLIAVFFARYDILERAKSTVQEGFLSSASRYKSLLLRALELGYTPSPGNPATVELTVRNNAVTTQVVRTTTTFRTRRVGNTDPVEFEMDAAADLILLPGTEATVPATQGRTITAELLGTADGTELQRFTAQQGRAAPGSDIIYVTGTSPGSIAETWSRTENLLLHDDDSAVYEIWYDEDGKPEILFGDGTHGRKPEGTVELTYRVMADGQNGNVPAGTIVEMSPSSTAIIVTNATAASGWSDADSAEEIRFQAARSARVPYDHCVAEEDIPARVERAFPDVGRCYVVPGERGENSIGVRITDASGNAPTAALCERVRVFVERHNPGTERVFVGGPSYTTINVIADIEVDPASYVDGSAETALAAAYAYLALDNAGNRAAYPALIIYPSALDRILMNVTGVVSATLRSPIGAAAVGTSHLPLIVASITTSEITT